jgi:hypothetical protein
LNSKVVFKPLTLSIQIQWLSVHVPFSLLHEEMKPDCEQSTAILRTKNFQRNSAETIDICPQIENMIFEGEKKIKNPFNTGQQFEHNSTSSQTLFLQSHKLFQSFKPDCVRFVVQIYVGDDHLSSSTGKISVTARTVLWKMWPVHPTPIRP